MFRLLGVEAITVVPAGSDMGKAMKQVADALAAEGRKAYVIPGGGSNALGGLGYVACAQELQQQWFELGIAFDRVVVGSGSSGTHGGLVAGFLGDNVGDADRRHRHQPRPGRPGAAGAARGPGRARPARRDA